MVKYVVLFSIPPGTDSNEIYRIWTGSHARNITNAFKGLLKRYVRNQVVGPPQESTYFGVDELWFESEDAANRALSKIPVDDFGSRVTNIVKFFVEETEVEL